MSEKRIATSKVAGTWPWFFQRFSAVALVALLGIHIFLDHFAGITGKTAGDNLIDFDEVNDRLVQGIFVVVDVLLLAFVLFHGFNGARTVALDFDRFAKHKRAIDVATWVVGIALLVWGIVILIPFMKGA